jgi:hydrogenase/urease accessory protein HupE
MTRNFHADVPRRDDGHAPFATVLRHLTRVLVPLLTLLVGLTASNVGHAHENTPAVLAIKEVAESRYLVRWTPPFPDIPDLTVHLPPPCTLDGRATFEGRSAPIVAAALDCNGRPLAGEVTFTSDFATLGPIGVSVTWADGTEFTRLSSGLPSSVALGGTSASGGFAIFADYVQLGVKHILVGIDHLLFLLGFLLLVRNRRALIATISAFTVAHSLTLVAASLELLTVPVAPVEICIALSVLLLAVEASQTTETVTRRRPWTVAFAFGLLHGLGFASALSDVGLPKHAVATSLLGFNVGVELGQLLVVAVALVSAQLLRRVLPPRMGEWALIAVLASCSTYWLLDRVYAWLTTLGV